MDKITEARRLWHDTFGDTHEWIDMYLSATGAASHLFYVADEADGHIISQLFLPVYRMRYHGQEIKASYISGAATVRTERGRGLMRGLIAEALCSSYRDNDALCMLIPAGRALYSYYYRSGFRTVFYISEERYADAHIFNPSPLYTCMRADDADHMAIANAYGRLTAGYICPVLHVSGEFRALIKDIQSDGGDAFVCKDAGGRITGVAFALPRHAETVVREIAAESDEARDALLATIKKHFGDMPVTVITPPDRRRAPIHSRAMARICNASAILSAYASAFPDAHAAIRLTDPVITDNNHTYIIDQGTVTVDDSYGRRPDLDVTVSVLTSILFSAPGTGAIFNMHTARPYISLMLD